MIIKKSVYIASLTREQFLFYETRETAKLFLQGLTNQEIMQIALEDNIYQLKTDKSTRTICIACIKRLKALDNKVLTEVIANSPAEEAKQVCLYAFMKHYRIVWDFMITVIGEKFRTQDYSFSRADVNAFMTRLIEQDEEVAAWSESTSKKIKSVLIGTLVDNGYLETKDAKELHPVLIYPTLENILTSEGEIKALSAFNCFK